MSSPDSLIVLMDGERAGVLLPDNANHIFEYDDEYRHRIDATPLSLGLPLASRRHTGTALTNFLWGFLPDNDRVLDRWGAQFGVSSRNPFGLLAHVGEDCAGAVQFVQVDRVATLAPGSIEWLTEADVAARIRAIRTDSAAWLPTGATSGYHSLAGAQPKFALARDGEKWGIPTGARPTTHIVKPNLSPFADFDVNEHLCLAAANVLGLRAARSEVVEFGGERALVVERYDRLPGTNRRVHQEDMCQTLGVHPLRKYQSDHGPSVGDIGRAIREYSTARSDDDIMSFADALAFSWLTMGTDAHAKNYSILLAGAQVRLAPLYDLSTALPYQVSTPTKARPGELQPSGLRLAMKIGGRYEASELRGSDWRLAAGDLGIDVNELIGRVADLASGVGDAFATAAARSPVAATSPTATIIVDRVNRHAQRCRQWLVEKRSTKRR